MPVRKNRRPDYEHRMCYKNYSSTTFGKSSQQKDNPFPFVRRTPFFDASDEAEIKANDLRFWHHGAKVFINQDESTKANNQSCKLQTHSQRMETDYNQD